MEALYLLLKTCDIIVVNYNIHSLGFLHPCLVLEVQSSCWKCCLGKQVEIHLQKNFQTSHYLKIPNNTACIDISEIEVVKNPIILTVFQPDIAENPLYQDFIIILF